MLEMINWETLHHLVYDPNEAKTSALSLRRYEEMVSTYEDYARKHGHA